MITSQKEADHLTLLENRTDLGVNFLTPSSCLASALTILFFYQATITVQMVLDLLQPNHMPATIPQRWPSHEIS